MNYKYIKKCKKEKSGRIQKRKINNFNDFWSVQYMRPADVL